MITLITGGERSGKSSHAQMLALSRSATPVYVATARRWDRDFEARIARHQQQRDERWVNMEEETHISRIMPGNVVVIDCITLWLTNIFADHGYRVDDALAFASAEINNLIAVSNSWIIVTNEIGMGVHATTEAGRKFVELQGWVNQLIAAQASEVILMVCGLPLTVKKVE